MRVYLSPPIPSLIYESSSMHAIWMEPEDEFHLPLIKESFTETADAYLKRHQRRTIYARRPAVCYHLASACTQTRRKPSTIDVLAHA